MTSFSKSAAALLAAAYMTTAAALAQKTSQKNIEAQNSRRNNIEVFIGDASSAKAISPAIKNEFSDACTEIEIQMKDAVGYNDYAAGYRYLAGVQDEVMKFTGNQAISEFNTFISGKMLEYTRQIAWQSKTGIYSAKFEGKEIMILVRDFPKEKVDEMFSKSNKVKELARELNSPILEQNAVHSEFMIKAAGTKEARFALDSLLRDMHIDAKERTFRLEYALKCKWTDDNSQYRIIMMYANFGKNGRLDEQVISALPALVK